MAFYKSICIIVALVTVIKGDVPNTNWTTIYRFYPLDSYKNFIVLEPKVPSTNSTGYSVCMTVAVWKWDFAVVFDSPALVLKITATNGVDLKFCLFKNKFKKLLCITLENVSSEWNAICFTHNFTDFLLKAALNGEPEGNKTIELPSTIFDELTKPISIGLNTSFWGQITHFNIWNRPLTNDEVNQYSFGCQDGLSPPPEILDWLNASILNRGASFQHYKIKRQLLACEIGMITPLTLFENANSMSYPESMKFCNLLKGELFDPASFKSGQDYFYGEYYWVPIKENGSTTLEYNTQLGKQISPVACIINK
jgi:hypothetical protein